MSFRGAAEESRRCPRNQPQDNQPRPQLKSFEGGSGGTLCDSSPRRTPHKTPPVGNADKRNPYPVNFGATRSLNSRSELSCISYGSRFPKSIS